MTIWAQTKDKMRPNDRPSPSQMTFILYLCLHLLYSMLALSPFGLVAGYQSVTMSHRLFWVQLAVKQ